MTNQKFLPRIAMFHGGGSTPRIFEMQCETLQQQLSSEFEFVYFGAPFESAPGKGVLPFFTFEEWGPYLNWYVKDDNGEEYPDGTAGNYDDEEGIERVLRLMKECGPGGKWVGCLGFSQGTRLVGGLLKWQQLRRDKNIVVDENIDLQFGVLCMGAGQPMKNTVPENLLVWDQNDPNQFLSQKDELIRIPTLHLHGRKDFFFDQGKHQMKTYFDQNTVTALEIDYHHAMPWNKEDVALLVENIRKMQFR